MTTVLAFGTYNTRKHPRVGILISGLRYNGVHVDQINRPLELTTAERVEILNKPWKLFGFAMLLLRLWRGLRHDAQAWMRRYGKPDAVLVGYLGHFDVLLARRVFKGVPIMLDQLIFAADTARDRGSKGLKVRLLSWLDRRDAKAATLLLTDTAEQQRLVPRSTRSMVVPVGAEQSWYDAGVEAKQPRKGIVFYGLYTPLQGTPVIAEAIALLAKEGVTPQITMIGKGQDCAEVRQKLTGLPHVKFVEWMEPELLPKFVSTRAISLGIFSAAPKGLRVVPNKVYQSLAAGCAVITSATAPQQRMIGDGAISTMPGAAGALADAIASLLANPDTLAQAQHRASEAASRFHASKITRELSAWITALPSPH